MPCLVAKYSGKYRHMLIFKSNKRDILHKLIYWVDKEIISNKYINTRCSFDIDPQDMS